MWVFIESSMLASWGTTPGKALLRVKVRSPSGGKLSFSEALARSFDVWWRGMGLGFPLVALITNLIAYKRLTAQGATTWDRRLGSNVSHTRIGFVRGLVAGVLITFLLGLSIVATVAERIAPE